MCLAFHPEGSASLIAVRPSIRLGTVNLIGKHCWSARIRTLANGAICDRTLVIRPDAPASCAFHLLVKPVGSLKTGTRAVHADGRPPNSHCGGRA
jgi:hypothetical protein